MKGIHVNLKEGNILKALILFTIPILIANLFQQLYNTVDTMIVGNYLGDLALAAMGSSSAVYELLIDSSVGIGIGFSIVIARLYGHGDKEILKKAVALTMILSCFISIIIVIFGSTFLKPLLELLHTAPELMDQALRYIRIITFAIPITLAYNLTAGLLRAIGNSFTPLIVLLFSSILNIILDIFFISYLKTGVEGAAIATVISQTIAALLCILFICRKSKILVPHKHSFVFDKELTLELLSQGLSMGFMLSIVSFGTLILQSAINQFSYLTIAAHTTARKVIYFLMMPMSTLGNACATFVSQNKGANQMQRIKDGIKIANLISITLSILALFIVYSFAPAIIGWVSGSTQVEVIETGAMYLRISTPFFAVLGILFNLRNALQGMGQKIVPLFSSIIELAGKIIFTFLLIPSLGYVGVCLSEPIIWVFMTLQLAWAFYRSELYR